MGIDNAQYATLDTADSLINTVVPIVCGILVDWYGPFAGAIASSIFILIGAVISSIAASKNAYHLFLAGFVKPLSSFSFLLFPLFLTFSSSACSQIVFGLGSSYIEIVQNTLYSWFAVGGGIMYVWPFAIFFTFPLLARYLPPTPAAVWYTVATLR